MLTPGEFVVNAKATAQHLPLLKSINSGAMSTGGMVYAAGGMEIPHKQKLMQKEANRIVKREQGELIEIIFAGSEHPFNRNAIDERQHKQIWVVNSRNLDIKKLNPDNGIWTARPYRGDPHPEIKPEHKHYWSWDQDSYPDGKRVVPVDPTKKTGSLDDFQKEPEDIPGWKEKNPNFFRDKNPYGLFPDDIRMPPWGRKPLPHYFTYDEAIIKDAIPLHPIVPPAMHSLGGVVYAQDGGQLPGDRLRTKWPGRLPYIDPGMTGSYEEHLKSYNENQRRYLERWRQTHTDLLADPNEGPGLLGAPFHERLTAGLDMLANLGEARLSGMKTRGRQKFASIPRSNRSTKRVSNNSLKALQYSQDDIPNLEGKGERPLFSRDLPAKVKPEQIEKFLAQDRAELETVAKLMDPTGRMTAQQAAEKLAERMDELMSKARLPSSLDRSYDMAIRALVDQMVKPPKRRFFGLLEGKLTPEQQLQNKQISDAMEL